MTNFNFAKTPVLEVQSVDYNQRSDGTLRCQNET